MEVELGEGEAGGGVEAGSVVLVETTVFSIDQPDV